MSEIDLAAEFDELLGGLAQISNQSDESVTEDRITRLEEGEVRNCAVLFADIKGFTALSERLGAEEVKLIIDHLFKILTQEIKRFNGLVDKYMGDCIMAVFGSEVSGENDSEMAIRAGFSMLSRLEQINNLLNPKGIELGLRIGINYGSVVYGSIGEGRAKDTTVMGDTVNTAQRMEANAPVNGILITAGTKKYLGDLFIYEDLAPIKVKNKVEPVPVTLVKGVNHDAKERWQRSALTGRTRFVGRESEITELLQAYDRCRAGDPANSLFVIEGGPGIGKSRLVYEFRKHITRDAYDSLTILTVGSPSYATPPYYVVLGLLRHCFGIEERDTPETLQRKLERGVRKLCGNSGEGEPLEGAVPIIGSLLNLDYDDPRLKMDARSLETERRIAFKRVFEALARREASTRNLPLVIVVDDLQWADSSSLKMLLSLATDIETPLPILICAMARSDFTLPDAWREFNGFRLIGLRPLEESELDLLVSSMLVGLELPVAFLSLLAERSQGNPFFLEEIIHLLVERRIIMAGTDGSWKIRGSVERLEVPVSVHTIILSRIDRLDPAVKSLLQKASVLGVDFHFDILERVEARTNREHTPESAERLISSLQERQLVFRAENGKSTDGGRYFFKNKLIQEVAYNTLLRTNRRILHNLTAEAIEEIHGDRIEGKFAILAYHYKMAENSAKALEFYGKAGRHYAVLYQFPEAKEMFREALDAIPMVGFTENEQDAHTLETTIHLLETCHSLGLYKEGLDTARPALTMAEEKGTTNDKARLYRINGVLLANLGDLDLGLELQLKARKLFTKIGDEKTLARIINSLGMISERKNRWEEAGRYFNEALEAAEKQNDQTLVASVHVNQGNLHQGGGDLPRADASFREALAVYERIGDRLGKVSVLSNIGIVRSMQGSYPEARECYEEGLGVIRVIGNRELEANMLVNLGLVHFESGEYDRALENNTSALEIYRSLGDAEMEGVVLGNMGRVEEHLGNAERARELQEKALEIAREVENAPEVGLRMTYTGKHKVEDGDSEEGTRIIYEGIRMLEELGIKEYLVEGKLCLGSALSSITASRGAGRNVLLDVIKSCRESGLEGMARQAEALLLEAEEGGEQPATPK